MNVLCEDYGVRIAKILSASSYVGSHPVVEREEALPVRGSHSANCIALAGAASPIAWLLRRRWWDPYMSIVSASLESVRASHTICGKSHCSTMGSSWAAMRCSITAQCQAVGGAPSGLPQDHRNPPSLKAHPISSRLCNNKSAAVSRSGWLTSLACPRKATQSVLAELFDSILKAELLLQRPAILAHARHTVEQPVGIYYCGRPPLSLKMKTPDAMHRASLVG